jgi:hypothetical protein
MERQLRLCSVTLRHDTELCSKRDHETLVGRKPARFPSLDREGTGRMISEKPLPAAHPNRVRNICFVIPRRKRTSLRNDIFTV